MKTYSSDPHQEALREISCHLCRSNRFRPVYVGTGHSFVKCRGCGLVYQNPQPIFQDLTRRYEHNYFQYEINNEHNFFTLMKLGLKDIRFDRLAGRFPRRSRFLDVGCATGRLLAHMHRLGWDVQGVEICRESAQYARSKRNLSIFNGRLQEAAFPGSHFSVVHFSHLLEHVPNPRSFLLEVKRILTPEGLAIITTPNISGLQARLLKDKWRSAIADHLTLFSKRTLRRLLIETGFRIIKLKTWGGIAQGLAPALIKRPVDRLAKSFGFGDVVLFLATRHA